MVEVKSRLEEELKKFAKKIADCVEKAKRKQPC